MCDNEKRMKNVWFKFRDGDISFKNLLNIHKFDANNLNKSIVHVLFHVEMLCWMLCEQSKKSVQCLGSIVPSMYPTIFMYCDHFIARIKHNVVLFKNSHKHEQHCHKHNVLLEAPWQWQCWARPISCEYRTTPKWIPHLC